jgi:hypothetical protein
MDRVSGFGLAASADWRRASNSFDREKGRTGRASAGLKPIFVPPGLGERGGLVICNRVTQKTHDCSIFASSQMFLI